jgi:hypothetical protein
MGIGLFYSGLNHGRRLFNQSGFYYFKSFINLNYSPMLKFLCYLVAGTILLSACNENVIREDDASATYQTPQRYCAAMEVLEAQLAADPKLRERMANIEDHTRSVIARGNFKVNPSGVLQIPVIVNVIYRTASENISLEQIQSQIDVLNEDFGATNDDLSQTPSIFTGVIGDFDVQFTLAGVVRKFSAKKSWQLNDGMKFSRTGGIDATNPTENLNMWVVNYLAQGRYLGFAQFPGGDPATDGVVIGHNFFGRTGVVSAPYNLGRTATHEVGHWMNLRHIWGDATCGNDFVADTPLHNTYNFGCPTYPHYSTCTGSPIEMTMNYMDYTDDPCMFMFTEGQKQRSLAIFVPGGPRATFAD